MITLQQELAWEKEMMERGMVRYRAIQQSAINRDAPDATSAGRRLLVSYVSSISEVISGYLNGDARKVAPEAKVLRGMDADKIALIALRSMLACVYTANLKVTSVAGSMGGRLEDEFHFMELETFNKTYFDAVIRALEQKTTSNYAYQRNMILQGATKNTEFSPKYWTHKQRVLVGLIMLQLVREATDLFEVAVSNSKYLRPTKECIDWVDAHDSAMELLLPERMPTIVEPQDWTSAYEGGYYSPELRATTPLIIRDKNNPGKRRKMYEQANMPQVLNAVNWLQRTGWQVNKEVARTMRIIWENNLGTGMPNSKPYEFPKSPLDENQKPPAEGEPLFEEFQQWKEETKMLHAMEGERKANCMLVSRNLRMAAEMEKYAEFYYVYRCDFRGRIYPATTGISPQGSDISKGLLQFSSGEPLGESGLYWLKVHGANKWGYDKCSYDARVEWIEAQHDKWCAIAKDPVGHRSIWAEAEKPYQFLAFCFEYEAASRLGAEFRSHLPIALDGSCNGLQHFSAMLRDAVGGEAVNLIPSDKPADIYSKVAAVAFEKLKVLAMQGGDEAAGAKNWLRLFRKLDPNNPSMPRKLAKRPVMTLPYGSTQRTCTRSIYEWYQKYGDNYFGKTGFRHAVYLTPILWQSIDEVVIAARAAMGWLQKTAGDLGRAGYDIQYTTRLGFPLHQRSVKIEEKRIHTTIGDGIRVRMNVYTDELDTRSQRQGASPNFVHSTDATHMMMVINKAAELGVKSFAMIHDDFGVPARYTQDFQTVIRDCFVELYSNGNILEDFKTQHEARTGLTLTDPPPPGTLDLHAVRDSLYFFG